jgi:predicted nucleotidyltransferase
MERKTTIPKQIRRPRHYRPPDVPIAVIRRYARRIVERFQPEKVILFGSFAYGQPHADSDVDLLVVMPAANEINQSIRIRLALKAPFPLDLIVRTPKKLRLGLEDGNWFLREVMEKGKVLYAKRNGKVASQGGSRPARGQATRNGETSPP